jgi:hypothetical protein
MVTWRSRWERLLVLRKSRTFRWGFGAALLLAFVALVLYRFSGDWRQLARTRVSIEPGYLASATALCGFNFLLFLIVWQRIVTALGGSSGWRANAQVYSVTYLTRFLPTSVWFFAGRIHFGDQIGLGTRHSLYATGLELGLHIATALCFYVVLELARVGRWWWVTIPVVLSLLIAWKLGWLRWLRLPHAVHARRRDLAWWSLVDLVTWVVAGPFLQAVVRAFVPSSISLWQAWRIWTLASLAGYAGFLLGGLGFLRELSVSALLTNYLLPGDALIVAVGARLVLLVSGIISAAVVVLITQAWAAIEQRRNRGRTVDDG